MRAEQEVDHAIEQLEMAIQKAKQADTFKYGMLVGKLVALGWVAGDPSGDMSVQYSLADWLSERNSMKGQIPPIEPTPNELDGLRQRIETASTADQLDEIERELSQVDRTGFSIHQQRVFNLLTTKLQQKRQEIA